MLYILYNLCILNTYISSFYWVLCFIPMDMEEMLHSSLKKLAVHQIAVIMPFLCDRFIWYLRKENQKLLGKFCLAMRKWFIGQKKIQTHWSEENRVYFLTKSLSRERENTIYSFLWWYKYFEMCHLSIVFLFSEVNRVRCNYSNCFSLESLYDKYYRKKVFL